MQEFKSISANDFEQHFKGNGNSNNKLTKYHGKSFTINTSDKYVKENDYLISKNTNDFQLISKKNLK